jgi:hypothetical protein
VAKHSNERIKLMTRDESEINVSTPTGNEVLRVLAENRLLAEELFEGLKKNPDIWRSAALKFKRVADLVRKEVDKDEDERPTSETPRIDDTYVFLMSVAIENTLKGLLMASGTSYGELTKSHDIAELYDDYCKRFGLTVAEDEDRLLRLLKHAALWAGRFNLPRRSKQLTDAFERHGLNIAYMGYGLSVFPLLSKGAQAEPGELRAEREKINALYERLYAHFLTVSGLNAA